MWFVGLVARVFVCSIVYDSLVCLCFVCVVVGWLHALFDSLVVCLFALLRACSFMCELDCCLCVVVSLFVGLLDGCVLKRLVGCMFARSLVCVIARCCL